jgi:beta-alanine degradation protein BauB
MLDQAIPPSPGAAAANPRAHWPDALQREYEAGRDSGVVGSVLVSETGRVRVWHLSIPPGGRCGFHRHVLNYFWTVHTDGRARGYFEDGSVTETVHHKGQTRHLDFGPGEYMVHSVENIGDTELVFTTVEFLDSPNPPLPVPDEVRMA